MEQVNSQTKKMNHNNHNNNNPKGNMTAELKTQQNIVLLPAAISRERSFVRTSNQQHNNNNNNKRRSLAFNVQQAAGQQMRGKPAMDIYRPPNLRSEGSAGSEGGGTPLKLNAFAPDFQMTTKGREEGAAIKDARSSVVFPTVAGAPHQQYANAQQMLNRRQAGMSLGSAIPLNQPSLLKTGHRPILAATNSQPIGYAGIPSISAHAPLINSPSSGNIFNQTANVNRVKFATEPEKRRTQYMKQAYVIDNNGMDAYNGPANMMLYSPLQRSKSLSSADALTRGIAGLGIALGNEVTDIGEFPPEIQALIDSALDDPNKLNSRCLMELSSHFIKGAVEGRRYALPIARCCLSIIAKEQKETFLEALLNTCRQWYQEREKLLFAIQGMKSPSRVRFTAFMAFLTEMFCQLKRRQLQLRTQCEGVPPPLVLLTLLAKCCEDCVKPPVRSLSEIECLFYVLTCIGQDLEQQMPQQLQVLLSLIRDAFLNSNDSAPIIRRTLLQLIELQASHWQLPGNTVLYYYPAAK